MRKILAGITTITLVIALACAGGGTTPTCRDGAVKVTVNHGKRATYHCHNGVWEKQ